MIITQDIASSGGKLISFNSPFSYLPIYWKSQGHCFWFNSLPFTHYYDMSGSKCCQINYFNINAKYFADRQFNSCVCVCVCVAREKERATETRQVKHSLKINLLYAPIKNVTFLTCFIDITAYFFITTNFLSFFAFHFFFF